MYLNLAHLFSAALTDDLPGTKLHADNGSNYMR